MAPGVLGRAAELVVIDQVLASGRLQPSVLVIRGEAGIGKSTLLDVARTTAAAQGCQVLGCAPDSTETRLSYAGLADVFRSVTDVFPALPEPQRIALEAALLHRRSGRAPDVHAVCAGTLALLAAACAERPVLIAIDDVQWLDESSARALAFALRRCRAPYALVTTLRDGHELRWPDLVTPAGDSEALSIELGGIALAPLHELLVRRVGPVDRRTMEHIAAVSRGNPLFAQELARWLGEPEGRPLPSALSSGMRARVAALSEATRGALLLCSALSAPDVRVLTAAGVTDPAAALAPAERGGIVAWTGDQVRFMHPMWREVVYRGATADQRREAHRRLSGLVGDIEERARHLALSSPALDPSTTAALVQAATAARLRGAPAQAAELVELALERGADDPELRLQAATDHLAAGRPETARAYARNLVDELPAGTVRAGALSLLGEITFVVDDFPAAIGFLEQAHAEAEGAPDIRVAAAIDLAFAYANLGDGDAGRTWALRAEEDAADPALAAEATGAAALLEFFCGAGVDQDRIDRALADEDVDRVSSPLRWPSMSAALIQLWSYDLDRARTTLAAVKQRCTDRGLERGLFVLLPRLAEAALLQGDVAAGRGFVQELDERAAMGGGESVEANARASRVVLAARTGDVQAAERAYAALEEIADDERHLLPRLVALAALGTCQLAAGELDAAAASLEPVGLAVLALGVGEPVISPFFADCIDTAAATGQFDRATAMVEMFERWAAGSGTRWPTGVGARGRAVIDLHRDDLDAAAAAAERALTAFDAPGFVYDRARTLLVVSRIQRRQHERGRARDTLRTADALFTRLDLPGWAAHTRRELDRLGLHRSADQELTPSERRIAELAGGGSTNAALAARLAVSPKTIEAHLSRIYRKLGIHSRAELGRWAAGADGKRDPGS